MARSRSAKARLCGRSGLARGKSRASKLNSARTFRAEDFNRCLYLTTAASSSVTGGKFGKTPTTSSRRAITSSSASMERLPRKRKTTRPHAFAAFLRERVQAFISAGDALFFAQRRQIAELALKNRLPSMFSQREYAEAGGLMSYGENLSDFFRRAASFVDKVFKGAKPGDLPMEQPTRFNLVINRKTADALGVTIPPQLYIFADEVIE